MLSIPFFQVDAFSHRPFAGNPAAICLLEQMFSDEVLQAIAAENNLAETAFLVAGDGLWHLRWFTPVCEVPLCGHATLAAAHILFQEGYAAPGSAITFETLSGALIVTKEEDWYVLDFPAYSGEEISLPVELQAAMQVSISNAVAAHNYWLLELKDELELRELSPDFNLLSKFPPIIVTARADEQSPYDFISRMFGPSLGINEDPVTGSAHSCLAPYWAERLRKTQMIAFQASARGGVLKLRTHGERVLMAGQACTIIKGTFFL
jgi:PhzF family phenazine biosynthesis protein